MAALPEDNDNDQQILEVQSLESIYDKEMKTLVDNKEFMIDVTPCIASGTSIRLSTSHEATPTTVSHLPPVTLYVKYTPTYPSTDPPTFHLSARWLNPELTSQLISKMMGLFMAGWPVVFDWVEYLKNEIVSDYCQLLNDRNSTGSVEPLATPSSSPPNRMFLRSVSELNDLTEYDKYQLHLEFVIENHECMICYDTKLGSQFMEPCVQCTRTYCTDCMYHYCQVRIGEGGAGHMTCPNQSCDRVIDDVILREIMDKDTYDKYSKLVEQVRMERIPGIVYCPRNSCNNPTGSDPNSTLAVCERCGYPFCKQCRQTWHGVNNCSVFDKLMKEESKAGNEVKKKESSSSVGMEELKNIYWLRMHEDVKRCPRCSSYIQKNGGCNKMTCWKCRCGFCWLCNEEISGYGHFTLCEMVSIDNDTTQEQEEKGILTEMDQLDQELLQRAVFSECPRCGQKYEKISQLNWVQCKRCKIKFCHLCGSPCYGRYHFSEYGCQEYTTVQQDIENMK